MGRQLLGNFLNLMPDPILILVFKWDIAGAVIATVIGNIAGALFYLTFFWMKKIGFEHFDSRLFRSSLSCSPGLVWAQPVANVLSTLLVILLYIEETKKISQKSLAAASSAL